MNPNQLTKVRSKGIMKAMDAREEVSMGCRLRIASLIPGRQCASDATCVGTHLPVWGKGTSTKVTDMAVACGCAACHDIIDGRDQEAYRFLMKNYPSATLDRMLKGLTETHALLIDGGKIIIPDGKII